VKYSPLFTLHTSPDLLLTNLSSPTECQDAVHRWAAFIGGLDSLADSQKDPRADTGSKKVISFTGRRCGEPEVESR